MREANHAEQQLAANGTNRVSQLIQDALQSHVREHGKVPAADLMNGLLDAYLNAGGALAHLRGPSVYIAMRAHLRIAQEQIADLIAGRPVKPRTIKLDPRDLAGGFN